MVTHTIRTAEQANTTNARECRNTKAPLPSRGPIWVVVPRPPSSHPDGRGQQTTHDGHQHHPKSRLAHAAKNGPTLPALPHTFAYVGN